MVKAKVVIASRKPRVVIRRGRVGKNSANKLNRMMSQMSRMSLRRSGAPVATPLSAPLAKGMLMRGVAAASAHIEVGDEYLMNVAIPFASAPASGSLLADLLVQPSLILNSRLRALASIYAQYRFSQLEFRIVSSCPATFSGMLACAVDKNVTGNPYGSNSQSALAYTMGVSPNIESSIWNSFVLPANTKLADSRQRKYLTDPTGTIEENAQYRLLITQAIPVAGATSGNATLLLKVRYRCEFDSPISLGIGLTAIEGPFTIPAGTSFPAGISSAGIMTMLPSGAPTPAASDNGNVYAVNPAITFGIVNGGRPIRAIVVNTTTGGTGAQYLCFPEIEQALANDSPSIGGTPGTGVAFSQPCDLNFIFVGKSTTPFHP